MRSGSNKTLAPFHVLLALALALGLNMELTRDPLAPRFAFPKGNRPSRLDFSAPTRRTAKVFRTGAPVPAPGLAMGMAMADFTGDTHPDSAIVEVNRLDSLLADYWIEIRLTEGSQQFLQLAAPFGGLLIVPKDVTGDGNLDLIVRSAKTRAVVAVFLNDGNGHFSRADTKAFAQGIPDGYLQSAFRAQEASGPTTVAYVESHGAECLRQSFGYLREQQSHFLTSNKPAVSQLFLSFGANRAPPSLA
jgi:hypothetical protein